MPTQTIGIVMNGVTGRMGTNQHLARSVCAIIAQGGVRAADGAVIMPRPILTGRNADKLAALAAEHGQAAQGESFEWTTDVAGAIARDDVAIVFDASGTQFRARAVELAAAAGKAVYCEKPTALTLAEALRLHRVCQRAGVKHGVVQDKLFLPGIMKLAKLRDAGHFGRILSVRGEFGYWVFTGHDQHQPPQRPSWNYRVEDGGGIMTDMFCHWRYVIDHTFGPVTGVYATGATEIPERIDEHGRPYRCTADDAAYGIFRTEPGVICQFNSSWNTRVRRDDLLTIQVDGAAGSAVAGLRRCFVQPLAETPRPVWNPDIPQPIDFRAGWREYDAEGVYDNAFKVQWEMFLRHVACGEPWAFGLLEGAKGVQLAEAGAQSWREGRWIDLGPLG
ncbi:MAG: Gfo/Idh/MocA family oxidoreductase [Phycisphaerales bacterium]|nr:Gfo/Idh/MocA family oxidoreductase [Phycisphaerales bacterium]